MSYSLRFRSVVSGDIASAVDKTVTLTADGLTERSFTVAASTTDQQVIIAFTQAALKGFYIVSDQDITLETNATDHTGGNQIDLVANQPYVWYNGCLAAKLFTNDVTTMYFTTGAITAAANVKMVVLHDATP